MFRRRRFRLNRLAGQLAPVLAVTSSSVIALGAPADVQPAATPANAPPEAAAQAAAPRAAEPAAPQPPSAAPQPAAPGPTPPAAPAASPAATPNTTAVTATPEKPATCDDEHKHEPTEGEGEFFVGPGAFDFSALNKRLAAAGYEKVPTVRTVIGGEGHAVLPSGFVVGARGGAVLGPDTAGPAGFTAKFNGGFGMVDFGYAFVHTEPVLLTLTGGFGGWGMGLELSDGQSAPFDQVLTTPKRGAAMGQAGLLAAITLGFDARMPISPVERGRRAFITIGVRLSGLYGPSLGNWDLSQGGDATSGPSFGLTGGFAALAIGFGGGRVRAPLTP